MYKANQHSNDIDFGKLPHYLGYQIRRAQTSIFRDFAQITQQAGLTPGEFSLLTMIQYNPGINQVTLARIYGLDKSTLSQAISSLLRRGLLTRTRGTRDRRQNTLRLTPEGEEALALTTVRVEAQETRMDGVLEPGEREALLDMLGRLVAAFEVKS